MACGRKLYAQTCPGFWVDVHPVKFGIIGEWLAVIEKYCCLRTYLDPPAYRQPENIVLQTWFHKIKVRYVRGDLQRKIRTEPSSDTDLMEKREAVRIGIKKFRFSCIDNKIAVIGNTEWNLARTGLPEQAQFHIKILHAIELNGVETDRQPIEKSIGESNVNIPGRPNPEEVIISAIDYAESMLYLHLHAFFSEEHIGRVIDYKGAFKGGALRFVGSFFFFDFLKPYQNRIYRYIGNRICFSFL